MRYRSILLFSLAWLLAACTRREPIDAAPAAPSAAPVAPAPRHLEVKTEPIFAGIASLLGQMQETGYQSWTPEKAVEKLLPLLNSAEADAPQRMRYVANQASGPWQVVLRAGDRAIEVLIYGSDPDLPIAQRSMALR